MPPSTTKVAGIVEKLLSELELILTLELNEFDDELLLLPSLERELILSLKLLELKL